MSDLVSRDDLLRYVSERIGKIKEIRDSAKLNGEADVFAHCNGEITEARRMKYHLSMFAPTIDAVPVVHARWVDNHCTACGMQPMGDELWEHLDGAPPRMEFFMSYCPCCGAKMDVEEEEDPPC